LIDSRLSICYNTLSLAPIQGKSGIPHETPISGLWFVGHQSAGGGGVSAVVIQAYQTAKRILESTSTI
jgi:phytoene dehydrogenase-like protein